MKKAILFVLVFLSVLAVQIVLHYRGYYVPPPYETIDFDKISVVKAPTVEFMDEFKPSTGTVVIDLAHGNEVDPKELGVLVSRLTARGVRTEFLESRGELRDKLKYADAYVVISPNDYSSEHVSVLHRFVEKGGRLLLVHDPTRRDSINDVSTVFGMIFDSGYLYNQVDNDGNYQYIFLKDFAYNDVTKGLSKVSMYLASSITSTATALANADQDTFSSTQPKQRFTPMVLGSGDKVLALGDLSFILEPYNSVFDNNKLVSNIADFLTGGGRQFYVSDYPYYLGDGFSLVYTDESLLDDALKIRNRVGRRSNLRTEDPGTGHTLVVGFYNSTLAKKYLEEAGITAGEKLEIKGVGKLQKNGSFLISLTQKPDRRVLLIAAADKDGVEKAISKLSLIDEITITDFIAYSTYESNKIPPPQQEEEEQTTEPFAQENSSIYASGKQIILLVN